MSQTVTHFDEYLIAADYLDEGNFPMPAQVLRDMAIRCIDEFRGSKHEKINLEVVYVIDGWAYVSDARILIRYRTSQANTELAAIDGGDKSVKKICDLWRKAYPTEGGTWKAFPPTPEIEDDDEWYDRRIPINNREISAHYLRKINLLPRAEYLQRPSEEPDPMPFRFHAGEGLVMPMRED